jgi:dCMP deaminase
LDGADIYITISPCLTCLKLVISAGIKRVFYEEVYTNAVMRDYALKSGVKLYGPGDALGSV